MRRVGPAAAPATAVALALACCAVLGAAPVAAPVAAQGRPVPPPGLIRPDVAELQTPTHPAAISQHPYAALAGVQAQRLSEAQTLRASGKLDAAREALQALLAEAPHHPVVLGELARIALARQQWPALERLARAERAATRDSVLLGRELAMALERQDHVREAAQVVMEVWVASPFDADWAEATVVHLDEMDGKLAIEPLRKATARLPQRLDLARAQARLEWKHGDGAAALKVLAAADAAGASTPTRWSFAEELLRGSGRGDGRDTSEAIEALVDLAADHAIGPEYRMPAARRAWQLYGRLGDTKSGVLRVAHALGDLSPEAWSADLLVGIVRGLREAGYTADVRALLGRLGDKRNSFADLALEGALNELREGPPSRALPALEKAAHGSPEGVFRYAEALFFAGLPDSAARMYDLITKDPKSPFTGQALERMFLIEDAEPREALTGLGRMAYETWRGETARAGVIADSLYHALPHGPLWAYAALVLGERRDAAGDAKGALEPLLAVADSLPDDRLASVARQRAGDVYRLKLKDDAKALAQYEECLARYPKAWNAPEVRRVVQMIRREKRF